jgi:hypothetical protein
MQATAYPLICIFEDTKPAENFVDHIKQEDLTQSEAYPNRFLNFWNFVHLFTPAAASQAPILGQNMVNHKIPLETAELCMQEMRSGHSVVLFYPGNGSRDRAQELARNTGARLLTSPEEAVRELLGDHLPVQTPEGAEEPEQGEDPLDTKEGMNAKEEMFDSNITYASTQLRDPEHLH